MIQLAKRLQYISAAISILGAVLIISHFHPVWGNYLVLVGLFTYGVSGILHFTSSDQRKFDAYAKLISCICMCGSIIFDFIFGTQIFYFAIILLAVSFFGAALPKQQISKW